METGDQSLWAWGIFVLLTIDVMIFVAGYYVGRLHRQRSKVTVLTSPPGPDEALASTLSQGLATLSERLRSIEGRLSKVCNVTPEHQVKTPEGDRLQYAARMAAQGNSVEELMAICNLGRGEAELIKLLHDAREIEAQPGLGTPMGAERN